MSVSKTVTLHVGSLLFALSGLATAAPINDNWNDRIAIPSVASLPYSTTETDVSSATADPTDPKDACNGDSLGALAAGTNSLWYSYTTGSQTEYINLTTQNTLYYTGVNGTTGQLNLTYADISVYTGSPGSFEMIAGGCNRTISGFGGYALLAGLRLAPNTTYSIQVDAAAALSTVNPPPSPATTMPTLVFSVSAAPIYTVNRNDDPIPAAATCSAADCSIREAINAANAVPGAILIPAGSYTMTSTTTNEENNADGDFDLQTSLSIYGAGMGQTVINAPVNDRVFDFRSVASAGSGNGATNLIADLSLIGPGDPAHGGSGAFTWGGGLVRGRSTSFAGLAALQRVELANGFSTDTSESSTSKAGGAMQIGTHAQILDSYIHDNTAFNGGGLAIIMGGAPTEIRGSLISNNVATNTAASSASSANGGGGIFAAAAFSLINSTVTANRAASDGGGISSGGLGSTSAFPRAQIRNSTISGNIADADGDGIGAGAGLRISRTAGVMAYNNIVYGNTTGAAAPMSDDCTGNAPGAASPWSDSYNLVGTIGSANASGGCTFNSTNNDQVGANPLLGALADNGGTTRTLALSAGSPAIDAGDPAGCTDASGIALSTDQRGNGFARPAGMRCDIGAFELVGSLPAPAPVVLDAASDSGSSNSDDLTNVTNPTLDGTCETSPASYTLKLVVDGAVAGSVACAGSPFQQVVGPLGDGPHAIAAYALDSNGAPSPQSAPSSIVIDTVTNVAITAQPADPADTAAATFEISSESGDTLLCTLDAGTASTCTSPVNYTALLAGGHQFSVDATDAAGNHATASYAWTIVAPAAPSAPVLDAGSDSGASNNDGVTNATTLLFAGACEQDGDSIQLLDGAMPVGSATCASGAYAASVGNLAEGPHAIVATTTRNGVTSVASAATLVVIDRTAPSLVIESGPSGTVVSSSAMFVLSVESGATLQCALDDASLSDCASPVSYNNLAVGAHDFHAQAIDLAGNVANASSVWTIVAPDAPAAPVLDAASDSGSSDSDGITNAQALIFHGVCTDGDAIQLFDGASAVGSSTICAGAAYMIGFSGLAEGTHAIGATATRDGLTSAQGAPSNLVIDRTAPAAPTVTGPAPPLPPTVTLTGTAEGNAAIAIAQDNTSLCETTADATGAWSCTITFDHDSGNVLALTATDIAGNVSSVGTYNADTDVLFQDGFDGR